MGFGVQVYRGLGLGVEAMVYGFGDSGLAFEVEPPSGRPPHTQRSEKQRIPPHSESLYH